ncbi:MAG: sigma-70 family RNA polymerase sigma factor [Phycisphaerales bacterium]|nr:sigma-70 family RNA polymerase sigma factor [Phycisphaerales bacterium]
MTVAASVHAPHQNGSAADGFDGPSVDRCTARMVAGDRTAYEALFRERCGFVERESARRLGRRRDLADDVAQEAWLRIARRPCRCPSAASLDAWLRRVVRSAAIDLLRSELSRRARELQVAEDRRESVAFLADHDLLEDIRREAADIAGLTDQEQSLFELKVRADATITQLAAMLGLGRAAVDSTLRRAAERARTMRNRP